MNVATALFKNGELKKQQQLTQKYFLITIYFTISIPSFQPAKFIPAELNFRFQKICIFKEYQFGSEMCTHLFLQNHFLCTIHSRTFENIREWAILTNSLDTFYHIVIFKLQNEKAYFAKI